MKKDIEWLKREVLDLRKIGNNKANQTEEEKAISRVQKWAWNNCIDRVYDLIGELDEPEVLSQELPVIPKYVAEYLDYVKERFSLIQALETASRPDELPKFKKENVWISANDEVFTRAWLNGYTVEEEPKYYVYLGDGQYLVSEDGLKEHYAKIRHEEDIGFSNYVLTFTEQEIKDYDPRYMAFAKPAEEVE